MPSEITGEELRRQREAASRVYETLQTRNPRAFVDTYGCQQNEADSEKLRGMLIEMGCSLTDSARDADIVVVNTCSVREHAEARVFGVIGALGPMKRDRPDMIVCVCGCMAQRKGAAERLRDSYRHVDLVFGTHALHRFPELLLQVLSSRSRVFETPESDGVIAEGLPVRRDGRYKAWLNVMYGCDNFCAYCIVPYVRGRERSRRAENVLADARELISLGYRDITLLGQNVNSYGAASRLLPRSAPGQNITFPELLRRVSDIPGDYWIRFMTSHPKDAGDALFRAMAESERVARCLHLPFQSGSSRVLELMNRGYTRERYLELIDMARELMPDIVITSDVIVGFPGEEPRDFEATMSLIEAVRFDALFTFIYSPRPGAPSALTENNTPRDEIQRRFEHLVESQNRISEEKHAEYVGKTVRVLVDGESGDAEYPHITPHTARTSGNRLVRLNGGTPGEFCNVKITGANRWSLTAIDN